METQTYFNFNLLFSHNTIINKGYNKHLFSDFVIKWIVLPGLSDKKIIPAGATQNKQ